MLMEFDALDNNLLENSNCKILDEYPYYMMDEPININLADINQDLSKKGKAKGKVKKTPKG